MKKKEPHNVLGKIASELSEIINKRGWFTKAEKQKLNKALDLLNEVLAVRIKRSLNIK